MNPRDEALARMLLERGLLSAEEHAEAVQAAEESGKPLPAVLVARSLLSAGQVESAVAALDKRVRFCGACNQQVLVPRLTPEGAKCPRCLGPIGWQEEAVVAQIRDVESIVQLAQDELPPEVESARRDPTHIFGKYILLGEAGRGGAGVVQRAWDTMLGETVALKFIKDPSGVPESATRAAEDRQTRVRELLKEARAAMRLRHPNIVAIRDAGRIDNQFYITMDYIEGNTLAEHLSAAKTRGWASPLYEDPQGYLTILRDVALAIHHAHTQEPPIVHCDMKPGNILIGVNGVPFVVDFGLARALGRSADDTDSKVRGTPAYMAPEQLTGRSSDLGPWTDVYGLGAVLYELLTGRRVFTGEVVEVLAKAMHEAPERPTEVLQKERETSRRDSTKIFVKLTRLESVALKCLAKEPRARYATAREIAEELDAAVTALAGGDAAAQKDLLPGRVARAQKDADFRRIDARLTQMDVEKALEATGELSGKYDDPSVQQWVADRRKQVEFVERFRARLVARINERRPVVERLLTSLGTLEHVEVLKATPVKLFLLREDRPFDLAWTAVPPLQIVSLAEQLEMNEIEDLLALGILCHHARLMDQTIRFLGALRGTPLEAASKQVLSSKAW